MQHKTWRDEDGKRRRESGIVQRDGQMQRRKNRKKETTCREMEGWRERSYREMESEREGDGRGKRTSTERRERHTLNTHTHTHTKTHTHTHIH